MNPSVEEDLGRQLHDWAVGEMQFQPAGQYTNTGVPSPEEFQKICRGKVLINVWKFVLGHVRSLQTVKKVQENLTLKKYVDQAKGARQHKGQGHSKNDPLLERRARLSEDLTSNLNDVDHLETDFQRLQKDLIQTDQEYNATVARIQDLRRQVGLIDVKRKLDAETAMEYEEFKKRVEEKTDFFTKKAKGDGSPVVLYHTSSAGAQAGSVETQCCHEVRETCEDIESLLQDKLQGTCGEGDQSFRDQQQRLCVRVDDVLSRHAAHDILHALLTSTHRSSVALRERTLQINVKEDVENLKFKHEKGGQLTDISAPVTLLHSVHELIEKCQRDHVDQFIETLDHRNAAHRTHRQTEEVTKHVGHALRKLFANKPSDIELARKLIAKEVKLAEQRSKVACLVEQANDLKEQIHRAAKEKNFLVAQFEKIRYFKEVAQNDCTPPKCGELSEYTDSAHTEVEDLQRKQNLIQLLAKQNAGSQPRLDKQKSEIVRYVHDLSTHHADTVSLAHHLDGTVVMEIDKTITLSLPYCMTVYIDSAAKVPVIDLSIHHASHPLSPSVRPALAKTLQHLKFPYEKAAESVLCHCVEFKSRLQDVERLATDLQLTNKKIRHSQSDEDSVENVTSLCSALTEYSQRETNQLVPILQQSVNQATSALSDCIQTKDHIEAWWELPAQHLVPWVAVDGQTYGQCLNQWRSVSMQIRSRLHHQAQ